MTKHCNLFAGASKQIALQKVEASAKRPKNVEKSEDPINEATLKNTQKLTQNYFHLKGRKYFNNNFITTFFIYNDFR